MQKPQTKVTDLDVMLAHPITVESFDANKYIVVDFLNLSLSKPLFKNKIVTPTGYSKTVRRKLVYTYDNGKQVDIGEVTMSAKKQAKMKDVSYMISFNKSSMAVDQVKLFLKEDMQKKLKTLDEYRKLKKAHTNDDRLMAVATFQGKQQLITADSREDFKRMAAKDKTFSYKIVSEKFGFNYPKSFDKFLKKNFPDAKVKKIRKCVEEFFKHNTYDYKKIAKLLTGKSKTKNSVKVFAKRFISRVCGDRVWLVA